MFKDSKVTSLSPWVVVEESDALPEFCYPAFAGTGLLGVGLDAGGLQSLQDQITTRLHCDVKPFHNTQADLYVLREGMISEHLWQDEVKHTSTEPGPDDFVYGRRRNFMPLGYITQEFEFGGRRIGPAGLASVAGSWRREWDLHRAVVRNRYAIDRGIVIETEVFAPHGTESVFVKLTRRAARRRSGEFRWTVRLPLETRHGLKLFDQPGSVTPGKGTILATIDPSSCYKPSEAYGIVYGVAAAGMHVSTSADGWEASISAPLDAEQVAWLRLEFCRFAGKDVASAAGCREVVERRVERFSAADWEQAKADHVRQSEEFWSSTADIETEPCDSFELKRRFLMHMSEYLFRCANDFSCGGTAQFLLFHQNGWGASNFHDHHYIVDGVARANIWYAAEANARWMRRVMSAEGRAFPWMMTYNGEATVTPERDRAPMSDANRAMLAARIYELAGRGREALLRDVVYPIVKRVADMAVDDWFYEENGRMLFRGVENDVMGDVPIVNEASTVLIFLSLIRKALDYSQALGLDEPRRAAWQRMLDAVSIDTAEGRYVPHLNAAPDARAGCWLCNIYYLAECRRWLDDATYARTRDHGQRHVTCNLPWIASASASSEIRLGRPDRAEQHLVEVIEHGVHGPGYFEECAPAGVAGLPPFATAHGAYIAAACEQVVLPDFWDHRVSICTGMPSKLRARRVRFSNLRARDGLIVSGVSEPRRLAVQLYHRGEHVEMELVLRIPSEAGMRLEVLQDGRPAEHEFHGETVTLRLPLEHDQRTELVLDGQA